MICRLLSQRILTDVTPARIFLAHAQVRIRELRKLAQACVAPLATQSLVFALKRHRLRGNQLAAELAVAVQVDKIVIREEDSQRVVRNL
jgi:hypothetical protein